MTLWLAIIVASQGTNFIKQLQHCVLLKYIYITNIYSELTFGISYKVAD
jgi:hypothetical protein